MIKVEITPNQARLITRSGTTKDGRPYSLNEQKAYIYLGGDYPTEFTLSIPQGHAPYAAGFYNLGASSLQVGAFGRLEVSRDIALFPVQDAKDIKKV